MPLLIVMALLTCTTVGLIPHYTIIVHNSAIGLTDPPTSLHTCTRGCLETNRFLGSLDFLFNRAEVASPVIRPRGTASHNSPRRSTFFRFRRTLCCDGFSGSPILNPNPQGLNWRPVPTSERAITIEDCISVSAYINESARRYFPRNLSARGSYVWPIVAFCAFLATSLDWIECDPVELPGFLRLCHYLLWVPTKTTPKLRHALNAQAAPAALSMVRYRRLVSRLFVRDNERLPFPLHPVLSAIPKSCLPFSENAPHRVAVRRHNHLLVRYLTNYRHRF